jgi:cytochrome c-type biogenesis protein CcmH
MMSGFWFGATLLLALAVVLVLWPAIRARLDTERSHTALNISLYRERMAELEQERLGGLIDEGQYEATRQELEAALLSDVEGAADTTQRTLTPARPSRGATLGLVAVAMAVPGLAFVLHDRLYEPPPLTGQGRQLATDVLPGSAADTAIVQEMRALVRQLATRMEANPDDGHGWVMLAQSYRMLDEYPAAVGAYRQALQRLDENADLLTEYADALIMAADGRVTAQAAALTQRALGLDPNHQSALWLAGVGAYQTGDYAEADVHWTRLLSGLPGASEAAEQVRYARDSARVLGLGAGAPAPQSEGFAVRVELEGSLADGLSGEETVLVFARAANGSRMPLAIERLTVADLPRTVTLDASNAMIEGVRLDAVGEVEIVARVSRDGMAEARTGDLEGLSGVLSASDAAGRVIELRIDTRLP